MAAARSRETVLTSADAVESAREAAVELAEVPEDVGEYLGATPVEERLIAHRFACLTRGYRGWVWTVTVSRVPRGRIATVCEAVLLPGDDAILPPPWVPWEERLRPGDVGPGDVLPFRADDPRLEPGWTATGDSERDEIAIGELALARERVLAPIGINEAASRWYHGRHGPATAASVASAESCLSCGFIIPLQGSLGTVFGVCANEWSPDDGKVVAFGHGCGAHSQTEAPPLQSQWPDSAPLVDELRVELTAHSATELDEDVPAAAGDDAADDAPAGDRDAPGNSAEPGA